MIESNIRYIVANGDNCLAILWQTKFGDILVCDSKTMDINQDITIIDPATHDVVKNVDLRELIMSILPAGERKPFYSKQNQEELE